MEARQVEIRGDDRWRSEDGESLSSRGDGARHQQIQTRRSERELTIFFFPIQTSFLVGSSPSHAPALRPERPHFPRRAPHPSTSPLTPSHAPSSHS